MATAIIIGVGPDQGLGAQLCKRFAAEGLNVLVAGRTKSALDAVVADIVAAGRRATAIVADATSEADIVTLFDKAGVDLDLAAEGRDRVEILVRRRREHRHLRERRAMVARRVDSRVLGTHPPAPTCCAYSARSASDFFTASANAAAGSPVVAAPAFH